MTMADRIVVMNAGRIEQIGRPLDLYDKPGNLFVASFLGSPSMNFAAGTVMSDARGTTLVLDDGVRIALPEGRAAAGARVTLGIRPEHIEAGGEVPFSVEVIEPTGAETHLYGKIGSSTWCVTTRARPQVEPGQRMTLGLPLAHLHLFDTESGKRLD
jgi:multiple sugar transport system ATP-binding protein